MKATLRKLFAPILNVFEQGDDDFLYKPSQRTILLVVGILFLILSGVSLLSAIATAQLGGLLPGVVFLFAGLVCEIVACLGNDRAVAKIWGSK